MRTTLKRAVGRAGGLAGRGGATFPPVAASPITRYRQPLPQPRSGLWLLGRVLLVTFLVLSSLGVGVAGGAYLYFDRSLASLQPHSIGVKRAQKELAIPVAHDAAVALLIGYDQRAGKEASNTSRSDTVMLVRADPMTKSVSLLSIPRDLGVPIYCHGQYEGVDRVNSAYARCGPSGTLETVRHLTGLPINFLITVNFHGFKEVVDKLGGVWMDVDRRYFNRNTGAAYDDYANIDLQPGYQRLTGGQALDFVRFRHTDDDYHRLARQQEFVRAVKEQVAQSFDPFELPALVNAVVSNIEVAEGGHALRGSEVLSYAFFAKDLPGGHFFQPRIEGVSGASVTGAPPGAVQAAVDEFEHPDVQVSKAANAAALGTKLKSAAPPPSTVALLVLNGNGVPGAAANASYLFAQRGYRTVTPAQGLAANAPQTVFHSRIYFDSALPRARAAATALQQLMQPAEVRQLPRRGRLRALDPGATLVVVLGQTFQGIAPPAPVHVPVHQPPFVRTDPSQATPLLQPLAKKAPFKLMVPTVLERSSYPDTLPTDNPARYYTIEGRHKGLRLVFRTGAGEFWGVQETDWQTAPILADKSFRHDLGGREFDLYYAGPHLHMVVLRTPHANYWVVNTLLDSLSNETMLAIANGLRPLTTGR